MQAATTITPRFVIPPLCCTQQNLFCTVGRYDDYIALFSAGADPLLSAPIKWGWAARSPSHIKLGVGSLE